MLTPEQLEEWEVYNYIEPIGEVREDVRMAYMASLILNIAIKIFGKKGAELTEPADFVPQWGQKRERRQQTVEEMKEVMFRIANVFGSRKRRKK